MNLKINIKKIKILAMIIYLKYYSSFNLHILKFCQKFKQIFILVNII